MFLAILGYSQTLMRGGRYRKMGLQGNNYHPQSGIHLWDARMAQRTPVNKYDASHDRMKDMTPVIVSLDAGEKAFDGTVHLCMAKPLIRFANRRNLPQSNKGHIGESHN